MPRLPVLSAREVLRALGKTGYYVRDQKGSHIHLRHPERPPLTVPAHAEVSRGTLRAILRQAGFTVEEFLRLLE
ncbi:MAG: type II toxin-antitoxin system HicA family toxin [Halobacteria archaeon]